MSKKNRNRKNKKKKESDGSTCNVNGGSSSNNNTTTMVLTQRDLEFIDNKCKLKGYPKSTDFVIGYRAMKAETYDLAIDAFIRGAKNDGCVPCMAYYTDKQRHRGNLHLLVPYALECAIRGHIPSMDILIDCYQMKVPEMAHALVSFWAKTRTEFGDTQCTEEMRKEIKKNVANVCYVCLKKDTAEKTFEKCGICKHYSYCGKDCQTYHWKEGKHMNECRHLILLRKYGKPSYVKEIREAIIDGQDPKKIHTLQRLRMKLGLNRPKEDYEELLLRLSDDNNNNNNNNNNNAMKPGTQVQIKGLVKASVHNGKFGIVTKVLIPVGEAGSSSGSRRVGVKLFDESGTVLSIKIENLEPALTNEYLIGRNDGTVHIGSTPNTI